MKKKYRLLFLLVLLFTLAFSLSVSAATTTKTKKVTCREQTLTIKVSAGSSWRVTSQSSWIKAKKVNNNKLRLTVSGNSSKSKRTGKVVIKASGVNIVYKIVQNSYEIIEYNYAYDWLSYGQRYPYTDANRDFLIKVSKVSNKLGVPADDLMSVMLFESSLCHTRVNSYSGATGLIQFMPSTAINLGTTTTKLAKMSAIKQMNYVYKYFLPYTGRLNDFSDLYMAVLWPRAVGQDDSYELWNSTDNWPNCYAANKSLDTDGDGSITKEECAARVISCRKWYLGA